MIVGSLRGDGYASAYQEQPDRQDRSVCLEQQDEARQPAPAVAGTCEGWSLVHTIDTPRPLYDELEELAMTRPARGRPARRRVFAIAAGVGVLVLTGSGMAVAAAHKTITLDVDGHPTSVSTFAGSVAGLLADEGIDTGAHDLVSATGPLRDGETVVVRHAHQISILVSGEQEVVWTTALTAAEAFETLADREGDLALVVSRSGSRVDFPLALAGTGTAVVVADGQTYQVADPGVSVAAALKEAKVTLGDLDEIAVLPSAAGVSVVVTRVVSQQVTTTSHVPFASSTTDDPSHYVGTRTVTTAGVPGVRTVVEEVITADGVERSRELISDQVTTEPVAEVVSVGSKPAPAPVVATPAVPTASGGLNWAALAACESGGNPTIVSKNGKYFGLYQFSLSTWASVGGAGRPSDATADEQTMRAQMLYERSGAGQWPVCGKKLFT